MKLKSLRTNINQNILWAIQKKLKPIRNQRRNEVVSRKTIQEFGIKEGDLRAGYINHRYDYVRSNANIINLQSYVRDESRRTLFN